MSANITRTWLELSSLIDGEAAHAVSSLRTASRGNASEYVTQIRRIADADPGCGWHSTVGEGRWGRAVMGWN